MSTSSEASEEASKYDEPIVKQAKVEPSKQVNASPVQEQPSCTSGSYIDLPLTRKAYQLVRNLNNAPELTHLLEESHHTGSDQKHHLHVPRNLVPVTRHMVDQVLRQMHLNMKRGRAEYGMITIRSIRSCISKLHG